MCYVVDLRDSVHSFSTLRRQSLAPKLSVTNSIKTI